MSATTQIGDVDTSDIQVVDHPDDQYYELTIDGERAGLLVYQVIGWHLTITHAMIKKAHRGKGLSRTLLRSALDGIRAKGATVSNFCPVVGRFIEKNPEYLDLISGPATHE